jgi:hypothetical protein
MQLFYIGNGIHNPIKNAPGLTIITEWIENGTLTTFIRRVAERFNRELPNRLLLELFLCRTFIYLVFTTNYYVL